MAKTSDGAAPYVDQTIGHPRGQRSIIDARVDDARPALEAYSQLLRSVAEAQE